jgi:hypothetical protein
MVAKTNSGYLAFQSCAWAEMAKTLEAANASTARRLNDIKDPLKKLRNTCEKTKRS